MQSVHLEKLGQIGREISAKTREWLSDFPDFREEGGLAAFFDAHPGLSLPDRLLGKGRGGVHVSLHTEDFNNVPHCHDFFEVVYVLRGKIVDRVGDAAVALSAGDALIHNPRALHAVTDFSGERDILLNIQFSREMFRKSVYAAVIRDEKLDAFFNRCMTGGTGRGTGDDADETTMVFRDLPRETGTIVDLLLSEFFRGEDYSEAVLESTILLLFAELLRNHDHRADNSLGNRILAYTYENVQGITASACAAHFGYHPKYFSVLVRKETGRTYGEMLTACRMKKAAAHLEFTDFPVERIAEMVGYRDAVSLYINFKKIYGMTPAEYRAAKQGRGGEE